MSDKENTVNFINDLFKSYTEEVLVPLITKTCHRAYCSSLRDGVNILNQVLHLEGEAREKFISDFVSEMDNHLKNKNDKGETK